ncbi:unnamed protein product [Mytilus edulis]|uniref:Myb/SANT-like DNA-binding domain-containing protein n=1 Tax=Mytilus edulis TaxID=6550 RepID=A0A8S3RLE3_MYTED|nr:unnamed protein product [Mytilus edulis]
MAESAEPNPSKLKRLKKTNFTVGEEDLIQQLVEKHSSIINGKLTNTVTNQLKKRTVRTPSKKVTVQDIHDMQYRALQGKIEIQEKQKIQMDFENKLELQIELLQKWMAVQSPLHSHRHLPLCIKCIKFIVILLICISEITMRPTHSFNFVYTLLCKRK